MKFCQLGTLIVQGFEHFGNDGGTLYIGIENFTNDVSTLTLFIRLSATVLSCRRTKAEMMLIQFCTFIKNPYRIDFTRFDVCC